MAQAGKVVIARTVASSQFRDALAQNAALFLSLDVKGLALGQRVDALLRGIQIVSVENLSWEIWLFRNAQYNTTDCDTNKALGRWSFVAATAVRIAGAGLYNYYIEGLQVPVHDEDGTSKVHMALINRSAASKTAGDAGELAISLTLEPQLGF